MITYGGLLMLGLMLQGAALTTVTSQEATLRINVLIPPSVAGHRNHPNKILLFMNVRTFGKVTRATIMGGDE